MAAAHFVNDQYAELVERHPDRFRAFAALPLPHVDEAVEETRRALDELHMAGVTMTTTVLGRALVDAGFEAVFAELDRRGSALYLHPAGNSACSPLIGEHHLTWMVGAPVEDTVSIMQLITRGFPTRYPNIKFINSHLGGALPMLLQRADNQYQWEAPDTPEQPSVAARRMWYDTVGHGHVPALRAAIDSVRRGPAPARHRLSVRGRGRLRARHRLHQRPAHRCRRREGHPRPERRCSARHRITGRSRDAPRCAQHRWPNSGSASACPGAGRRP